MKKANEFLRELASELLPFDRSREIIVRAASAVGDQSFLSDEQQQYLKGVLSLDLGLLQAEEIRSRNFQLALNIIPFVAGCQILNGPQEVPV